MNCLNEVFRTIEKNADRPFLIDAFDGNVFTFAAFHAYSAHLSGALEQCGLKRGDRLAILLNNSPEYAMIFFACLYAGIIAVPINPQLHFNEIRHAFQRSRARCVVDSPATRKLVDDAFGMLREDQRFHIATSREQDQNKKSQNFWSVQTADAKSCRTHAEIAANFHLDALLTLTFTSGTTGVPKSIPHRACSLFQSAASFNHALNLDSQNRFYHTFSMSYMAGILNTILCPFFAGASVVIDRPYDARMALQFWDVPMKYAVNSLWLVPTILSALLKMDRSQEGLEFCRKHIKTVCVGTAPLPLKIKEAFEDKYGIPVFESYGLSETLFVATNSSQIDYVRGSVGRLLPEINVRIADNAGHDVSPGEEGEIWIRTPFLMDSEAAFDEKVPPQKLAWFSSGDLGRVSSEQYLFITGRKKDLIIRGGVNISPVAVENVLGEHAAVENVAVVGLPHEFYGEEVAAAVKLKSGMSWEVVQSALDALCRNNLSQHSVPTRYFEIDEFPLTPSGKIQKNILRQRLSKQLQQPSGGGE